LDLFDTLPFCFVSFHYTLVWSPSQFRFYGFKFTYRLKSKTNSHEVLPNHLHTLYLYTTLHYPTLLACLLAGWLVCSGCNFWAE
jgi:hypothetical protein